MSKSGIPEHENGKENNERTFFSCIDTMFLISIIQSNTRVVSIATVFLKKAAIIIVVLSQKTFHWQLNEVIASVM